MFQKQVHRTHKDIHEQKEKRKALKEMELFVLDSSLPESTVGQLRGHTIENKWKIYEQVGEHQILTPLVFSTIV